MIQIEPTPLSTGHFYQDPKTKKYIRHFGPSSQFKVCVKRYNGRKVCLFVGSGDQIKEVIDFYNAYKIYRNDRKYIFHHVVGRPLEEEEKVLMENGMGQTDLPHGMRVGRKKTNYKHGSLASIKHVPKSILSGLDTFLGKGYVVNSQVVTKTRLVAIILANFLAKSDTERLEYLTKGDTLLEKHKISDGGVNLERLDILNDEDLL